MLTESTIGRWCLRLINKITNKTIHSNFESAKVRRNEILGGIFLFLFLSGDIKIKYTTCQNFN